MNNTLTVNQLQELLRIQKEFDDRIPTLNLHDSKIAYVVEFFEWFNTLETFKNWKKKPGKPLDVQLDELADMLAFGLSITHQLNLDVTEETVENLNNIMQAAKDIDKHLDDIGILSEVYTNLGKNIFNRDSTNSDALTFLTYPFAFSVEYYSLDQLIDAYNKKMEVNHARQDGTTDKDKGYV
ncbi:dUTPase [Staphylococcus hominis]|uniref:dUTPase n=1 Tax=Staphylococcus hominis TaxID=1290 RepID=UPI0025560461|nr:dUTPase [Staphylococcus hominis]MDK7299516.1 dUTPase [Staphylococcus hominis]